MKKRKKNSKLTEVQKLYNKIKRMERKLVDQYEHGKNAWIQYHKEHDEVIRLIDERCEQERIITMFKSCLNQELLEKVLKDDHIKYLEKNIETMNQPKIRHLHTPCNHH